MAERRRYSDEERANALAALAANGGNIKRTAIQLGLPEKTLGNWANGINHPEAAKLGDQKKPDMADALEALSWKLIDSLPDKIADASLAQTATSLAIAIDKMRLLREQATSIAGREISHDERIRRVRELIDRANARSARASDAGRASGTRPVDSAAVVVPFAGTADNGNGIAG